MLGVAHKDQSKFVQNGFLALAPVSPCGWWDPKLSHALDSEHKATPKCLSVKAYPKLKPVYVRDGSHDRFGAFSIPPGAKTGAEQHFFGLLQTKILNPRKALAS